MLELGWNLVVAPKIQKVAQRIYVQSSTKDDSNKGPENEPERPEMLRESKDGHANVSKDKVLRDKVAHLEQWFSPNTRLGT